MPPQTTGHEWALWSNPLLSEKHVGLGLSNATYCDVHVLFSPVDPASWRYHRDRRERRYSQWWTESKSLSGQSSVSGMCEDVLDFVVVELMEITPEKGYLITHL